MRAYKGELIAFLDSDELWIATKLAVHTRAMIETMRAGRI